MLVFAEAVGRLQWAVFVGRPASHREPEPSLGPIPGRSAGEGYGSAGRNIQARVGVRVCVNSVVCVCVCVSVSVCVSVWV